jgi:hypothetical protein
LPNGCSSWWRCTPAYPGGATALALPDVPQYRRYLASIDPVLRFLQGEVYLVGQGGAAHLHPEACGGSAAQH